MYYLLMVKAQDHAINQCSKALRHSRTDLAQILEAEFNVNTVTRQLA